MSTNDVILVTENDEEIGVMEKMEAHRRGVLHRAFSVFLFDSEGNNNWGVIMAGTTFVVLPLLIVYVFAQRFIIDGLTAGATKG